MKFSGTLLASDIDGTLISDSYLNPLNLQAIENYTSLGGIFCLATGRSYMAMDNILEKLKNPALAITYNGGAIYDFSLKKVLYQLNLNNNDKMFFKEVYNKVKDIGIEVYCGKEIYWIRKSAESVIHFDFENIKGKEISFDEAYKKPWNKAMCVYSNTSQRQIVENLAKDFNSKTCYFVEASYTAFGKNYNGYEQLPNGADKGTALKELKKILNIKMGKTFAIGDYYNDLTLLKTADISACVSSSPKDIKNFVDFVCCEAKDGAVNDFIEYLTSADF